MLRLTLIALILIASTTSAGPVAPAGDIGLRHDIQVLADYGAIKGPTTAWPVSWDAILADLEAAYDEELILPVAVRSTYVRVLERARRETRRNDVRFNARVSASEKPTRIRGFTNAPYDEGELSAGISWASEHISLDLNATGVYEPLDGKEAHVDGSRIAVDWGNVTFAASTIDRWWGPGWDGSLILSNNARPMPAITIGRNRTHPFNTKWLSWLGPWDIEVIFGQMESDRVVPDPRFWGMRFTFRPFKSLEIGLSRSAQWCGEGRPCDFSTFWDIFTGNDNLGDGQTFETEPSNQLAGFDMRWSNMWFGQPSAIYAQAIGEDEAGGFPSRYLGQIGIETSGYIRNRWSYRWYAEWAGTSCDVIKSDVIYNCAYNHNIYETEHRYRGRAIGHGSENDSSIVSTGFVLLSTKETQWHVLLRLGELNRGGAPDAANTLTPTPLDISSIDLTYNRSLAKGRLEIGVGYEQIDDPLTGESNDDARGFISWRSR